MIKDMPLHGECRGINIFEKEIKIKIYFLCDLPALFSVYIGEKKK